MMQVVLAGLVVDSNGRPVVLLRPQEAGPRVNRVLPIWIGPQEATAIALVLQEEVAPRPMSYDLMHRILEALDATVRQVVITRIEEGTFYAEITLVDDSGTRVLDARPSDSIALALRVDAPIFVAEEVFDAASILEETQDEARQQEQEVEQFHQFLDTVNPEDFRG